LRQCYTYRIAVAVVGRAGCITIVGAAVVLVSLVLGGEAGGFEARNTVSMAWVHILPLLGDAVDPVRDWFSRTHLELALG
jgi:hypothetical protein